MSAFRITKYHGPWSKEKVIEEIRKLDGHVELSTVAVNRVYRNLVHAAQTYCGGWSKAVVASGLPPYSPPGIFWTRKSLVDKIQEVYAAGIDVGGSYAQRKGNPLKRAYRANYHNHFFPTWKAALVAAIDRTPQQIRKDRDERKREERRVQLVKDIQAAEARGVDFNPTNLRKDVENKNLYFRSKSIYQNVSPPEYKTSRKKRNTWMMALQDAGVDFKKYFRMKSCYWTKETIKQEILERRKEGLDLNALAIERDRPDLSTAAVDFFPEDGWDGALKYAGLDSSTIKRSEKGKWNREIVKKEILRLEQEGVNLRLSNIRKNYYPLFSAAAKRYHGWYPAVEDAGINSWLYRAKRSNHSWNKKTTIEAMLACYNCGIPLAESLITDHINSMYDAAVKYYRSWERGIDKCLEGRVRSEEKPREVAGKIDSLFKIFSEVDKQFGLPPGTSLIIVGSLVPSVDGKFKRQRLIAYAKANKLLSMDLTNDEARVLYDHSPNVVKKMPFEQWVYIQRQKYGVAA